MYKLLILIPELSDPQFELRWPEFLAKAETMPGLLRESTSRVDRVLHGDLPLMLVHEMYFDSLKAASQALGSLQGESTGNILHEITSGKVMLFLADHKEDGLENIRAHAQTDPPQQPKKS